MPSCTAPDYPSKELLCSGGGMVYVRIGHIPYLHRSSLFITYSDLNKK